METGITDVKGVNQEEVDKKRKYVPPFSETNVTKYDHEEVDNENNLGQVPSVSDSLHEEGFCEVTDIRKKNTAERLLI
jgi:hypothetical protein